jgi:hypothetical protein
MTNSIAGTPEIRIDTAGQPGGFNVFTVTVNGKPVSSYGSLSIAENFAEAMRREYQRVALVAGVRALADWLEEHPDVPARVLSYSPLSETDRVRAIPELAQIVAAARGTLTPGTQSYNGQPCLKRDFGGGVTYHADFYREAVGTARIEDGAAVWDLPEALQPQDEES